MKAAEAPPAALPVGILRVGHPDPRYGTVQYIRLERLGHGVFGTRTLCDLPIQDSWVLLGPGERAVCRQCAAILNREVST